MRRSRSLKFVLSKEFSAWSECDVYLFNILVDFLLLSVSGLMRRPVQELVYVRKQFSNCSYGVCGCFSQIQLFEENNTETSLS